MRRTPWGLEHGDLLVTSGGLTGHDAGIIHARRVVVEPRRVIPPGEQGLSLFS